jgi:hypothetical protein
MFRGLLFWARATGSFRRHAAKNIGVKNIGCNLGDQCYTCWHFEAKMKTPVYSRYSVRAVSLLAFLSLMLTGLRAQERAVPLKNWSTPLYWQPNQAEREAAAKLVPQLQISANGVSTNALTFVAITPCRLVDTRGAAAGFNGDSPFSGPSIGAATTVTFPVQSSSEATANTEPAPCGVVPSIALAYSLNVTVIPHASGVVDYISIWPAGGTQPTVSTLNDLQGQIVANAAIVPAGTPSGGVSVYNSGPAVTDVIIDMNGYFAAPSDFLGNLTVQSTSGNTLDATNTATSGSANGVFGSASSTGANAAGVSGHEEATTGQVYGVAGSTNSTGANAAGVIGYEGATTGQVYGVAGSASSTSANSAGVTGYEGAATGTVFGVTGSTNSTATDAAGVSGYEGAATGAVFGVTGSTYSTTSGASGVNGFEGATTGGPVYGVSGYSASTGGIGVFGSADATSGYAVGVEGATLSSGGTAGEFVNLSGSGLVLQGRSGSTSRRSSPSTRAAMAPLPAI